MSAEEFYKKGIECSNKKDYDQAIEYQEKAIQIDPNYVRAWEQLGARYYNKSLYDKAIAANLRAIELGSKDRSSRYNLANSYYMKGMYDKAIEYYEKAIQIDPNYILAWEQLAASYLNKKLYDKSIEANLRALELGSKEKTVMYNLGRAYKEKGLIEKAIEYQEKVVQIDPNYIPAWEQLGIRYYEKSLYDKAIAANLRAIELGSKDRSSRYNLANSYYMREMYDKAIEYYEKAIAIDHNYELAWNQLVRAYEKKGDSNKANQAKQRSLTIVAIHPEKPLINTKEYIKKLPNAYTSIQLEKIALKTKNSVEEINTLIEDMIFDGELKAQIDGDLVRFQKTASGSATSTMQSPTSTFVQESTSSFLSGQIELLRGGDWKVEGNQSIFFYKVKVKNNSKFVINNIQIILTMIPAGLKAENTRYKIDMLKPASFESPTFKLLAKESCVGDSVEGIVTYTDPMGKLQSSHIEPFEICYVCNLLTPKHVSKQEFDQKTQFMEEKKLIIDSSVDLSLLESKIENIVKNCNFAMLQELQSAQSSSFTLLEAFAQGLYDKQDVGLSVAMQKVDDGSRIVIKAMSDKAEKVTDLLKDFSVKLDDIKSDTELIKEYTSQLEKILDNTENLEDFLVSKLGNDFDKMSDAWKDYKEGVINKKQLIGRGIKVIGIRFVKRLIGTLSPV